MSLEMTTRVLREKSARDRASAVEHHTIRQTLHPHQLRAEAEEILTLSRKKRKNTVCLASHFADHYYCCCHYYCFYFVGFFFLFSTLSGFNLHPLVCRLPVGNSASFPFEGNTGDGTLAYFNSPPQRWEHREAFRAEASSSPPSTAKQNPPKSKSSFASRHRKPAAQPRGSGTLPPFNLPSHLFVFSQLSLVRGGPGHRLTRK